MIIQESMIDDEFRVLGRHVTNTGVDFDKLFIVCKHGKLRVHLQPQPRKRMPENLVENVGVRPVRFWILKERVHISIQL